ncbi:hypothetical protein [Dysgonomonas macrotermitis]|uniref:Uncharacterized protein n=1 Tax=Dysgonomonas macrotermitis TaxID=1346286 RepID=A0A1M5E5U3_9BACT|nr:hypothetical protein [Dysgonomonas macrotermitis]SHF74546.1 hypothetical protein SAMN05444362_109156 [Dysgonomonas macrotermitis]
MKKDLLSAQFLKTGSAWIFLIIGIFLYFIGYFQIDSGTIWKEIVIKMGDILVIGVILGYLTNVAQLAGVFKSDLEQIIYAKEFINKRKDLPIIWENVTKALFKSKFPSISKDLLAIIMNSYLPVNNVSYYNDYEIDIELTWAEKDKNTIITKSNITFDLIAETKDKFQFPLKSWIEVGGLDEADYHVKVDNYIVNGKPANVISVNSEVSNGCHFFQHIIELEGETKYEISKTVEKKYSLEKDFTICFKALFLINKLTVKFSYPDDICACFISRGTVADFKSQTHKNNSFTMKYKELILPNQGYVISLKEKN